MSNVKQKLMEAFEGLVQFLVRFDLNRVKKGPKKESINHSRNKLQKI